MTGTLTRRQPDDGTHACPGPDCTVRVPDRLLACRSHWAQVSRDVQRRVYATFRRAPGSAEHRQAMQTAIAEMRPLGRLVD